MTYRVNCPSNTYLCIKNAEDIFGKFRSTPFNTTGCNSVFNEYVDNKKQKHTINKCPKVLNSDGKKIGCNDCDYLFENLIKGYTTCKDLYNKLKTSTSEELETQIKYNLYQLAAMKLKSPAAHVFGTFDWWKEYIWGVNKMQNYIHILSFIVAAIMVIYYTYSFLIDNLNNKMGVELYWIGYILLLAIVLCILIMVYSFKEVKYEVPTLDPRYSEKDRSEYSKKVRQNWYGQTWQGEWIIPIILSVIIVFFAIILIAHGLMVGSPLGKLLSGLAIYSIASLILSLNLYYTFLIPQFIIVGIILQKILLKDFGGWINLIFKGFIIILLLTVGIFQVIQSKKIVDPGICTQKKTTFNYTFQYFFIFSVLFFIAISSTLFKSSLKPFIDNNRGWGLFMEPYYYLSDGLYKFVTK